MTTTVHDHEVHAKELWEQALELERQRQKRERELGNLLTICCRYYDAFCEFENQIERGWAQNPSLYDQTLRNAIDALHRRWFVIFSLVDEVLEAEEDLPYLEVNNHSEFDKLFKAMLSIKLMDESPLPDRLFELAEEALQHGIVEAPPRPE